MSFKNTMRFFLCLSAILLASGCATPSLQMENRAWHWQSSQSATGEILRVAQPERYTLSFGNDGRVLTLVDCNRGNGAYLLPESCTPTAETSCPIKLEALALTRQFCLGESQADAFLNGLNQIARYTFRRGKLVLELEEGGNMVFVSARKP